MANPESINTGSESSITPGLRYYIEHEVIPRYDSFDKGHQRDHVQYVISQAMKLSCHYNTNPDMVYAAAAYHDTGLCIERKNHHLESARIIREDSRLSEWFTEDEINLIADAAEDHRASSDHEPRTIYGRLIAEADRQIIPQTVISRTIQFSLSHYPELDKAGHWNRMLEHLHEKYAEGGYLRLWIPESSNRQRLDELRKLIKDELSLKKIFDSVYEEELHG